tara:strand:+ start:227 stop:748 length:522 start_codon:yes stop_codon:yes gene_type:complete
MSYSIALGCSHTSGTGVESHEAWPSLLNVDKNLGKNGASTDYCARILRDYLRHTHVDIVYIFYPNRFRFEHVVDGNIEQSVPSDPGRINLMETYDDAWCEANYNKQTATIYGLCIQHNCLLVDLTLENITTIIDHNDRWPIGSDNLHNGPQWHVWLADLFRVRKCYKEYEKTR